jgi:hypothetical protein
MSGKYEALKKEIPIRGRNGSLKLWALLEEDFFGWDSFSLRYGLVDGEGPIPEETEKQHTHDYDQVLWFLSSEAEDMLHLGAELEVDLGETGIRHRFARPHAINVPKGTPHFSPIVKNVERPFFFITLNRTGKLAAAVSDADAKPETGPWARFFGEFARNVHALNFAATEPYHYGSERQQALDGYSTFFSGGNDEVKITMAWSTICKPGFLGPWGPDGKHHPHTHQDYNEALVFLSMDLDNLTDLHGEVDFCCGEDEELEHYKLTKATAMALQKGTPHLPLHFDRVDKPFVFITLSSH